MILGVTYTQKEMDSVLRGARSILTVKDFPKAARAIFDSCKAAVGATAGYVALIGKDGTENEVLFLDAGGLPCVVDPSLPMPIRGLRGESYKHVKVVYDNDFVNSEWTNFMPAGHVVLRNVMFAPLVLEGRAVGILGLANKDGGFTDSDAKLAAVFGELAAVALMNSKILEALADANKELNTMTSVSRHDILNQLTLLQGFESLAEELATDEKQKSFLTSVRKAVGGIREEMESTRAYEDFGTRMPAWQSLEEWAAAGGDMLQSSGIALESQVGDIEVYADPLFGKVMKNLVDNTVRHGESASHVKLTVTEKVTGLHILYEDDGPGISEDIRPRMFERGVGRHTGYGLYLIREILGMTGITISETGEPGKGVRFDMTVPVGMFRSRRQME